MPARTIKVFFCITALTICGTVITPAQSKALKSITEMELRKHLEFIASSEFRGRETPSPELEICALYLAQQAQSFGLKPILPDGSFFQTMPVTVATVSHANTRLRLISETGDSVFYYQKGFGGSFRSSGSYSGEVIFTGLGISAPDKGWADLEDFDLSGKVVVILDGRLPEDHELNTRENRLYNRANQIRNKGAALVLSIIDPERENKKAEGVDIFHTLPRGRAAFSYESQRRSSYQPQQTPNEQPQRPPLPFASAEISFDTATAITGFSKIEIEQMFANISQGNQVPGKVITGSYVELTVQVDTHGDSTRNILAVIEGSDPKLKNEYIVVCAHYDHLGIRNGEVIAGADDNGSGTVALLEIAQALMVERPKRSVITAWFTGEERGYIGSQYFVNNCPVPIEKISACLNMDMLCRNDPGSLYLVASDLLSSELDGAINKVNKQFGIDFNFSYIYSNRTHPDRVYYRSDQYPHIRFGIPSVWFFCGFTPDYHTPRDVLEFVDYQKMLKATKLVYLTAIEVGNKPSLLKLDVNPEVTSRGSHNIKVESIK